MIRHVDNQVTGPRPPGGGPSERPFPSGRGSFARMTLAIGLCLILAGCHILYPRPRGEPATEFAADRPDEVVPEPDDYLAHAAKCMERGDEAGAVPYMLKQIEAFPEQLMIRAYLAELLVRLKRGTEAKQHFERFIAEAQESDGPAKKHVVHCHTRLMELAQEREDEYSERLHRGIGLCLLAKKHDTLDNERPELTEQLIFKAIRELEAAQECRKSEARPAWYRYQCWTMLQQPRPAEKCLRSCEKNAVFSEMTPAEFRAMRAAKR
jgi:hypothetical protein